MTNAKPGRPPQRRPRMFIKGGVWWADFRLKDGTRRRVSTHQSELPLAKAAALRMANEERRGPVGNLYEAIERTYRDHWSTKASAHVMRRVCNLLQRQLGHIALPDLTYGRLSDYCKSVLSEGTAPATVNRRMSALGVVLREAVDHGELDKRPRLPHFTENNKRERYMSTEEESKVLAWLESRAAAAKLDPNDDGSWLYVRTLAVFLLDTGLRFSESYRFVLTSDGHASVPFGKSKSSNRDVPLTKRALAAARFLEASELHERLAGLPGEKAAWDFVSHRWKRATTGCGCPDVSLHVLRHTCASRLIQRGASLYTVSKVLGHSSVKVTERYAKLNRANLREAIALLEEEPESAPQGA